MRTKIDISHHFADLGDVLLHYVTAGKGPAVVLLHGWPQTWWEWRHVIPALAEKYTVIAPDMRGLGDSSRPLGDTTRRQSPTISGCSSPSAWVTGPSFWLGMTGADRQRLRWPRRTPKRCAGLSFSTWSSPVAMVISRKVAAAGTTSFT